MAVTIHMMICNPLPSLKSCRISPKKNTFSRYHAPRNGSIQFIFIFSGIWQYNLEIWTENLQSSTGTGLLKGAGRDTTKDDLFYLQSSARHIVFDYFLTHYLHSWKKVLCSALLSCNCSFQ